MRRCRDARPPGHQGASAPRHKAQQKGCHPAPGGMTARLLLLRLRKRHPTHGGVNRARAGRGRTATRAHKTRSRRHKPGRRNREVIGAHRPDKTTTRQLTRHTRGRQRDERQPTGSPHRAHASKRLLGGHAVAAHGRGTGALKDARALGGVGRIGPHEAHARENRHVAGGLRRIERRQGVIERGEGLEQNRIGRRSRQGGRLLQVLPTAGPCA